MDRGKSLCIDPYQRGRTGRVTLCAALIWVALSAQAGLGSSVPGVSAQVDWMSPQVVHNSMPPLPLLDVLALKPARRALPVVVVHGGNGVQRHNFGALPRVVVLNEPAKPEPQPAAAEAAPAAQVSYAPAAPKLADNKHQPDDEAVELDRQIAEFAGKHGVPLPLARAVVQVESAGDRYAQGEAGEIGLMQIMPATARQLGFTGELEELYEPRLNLSYGMRYLAKAYLLAGGDLCGTILRYNAGHAARQMNARSAQYCEKVKSILGFGSEFKLAAR